MKIIQILLLIYLTVLNQKILKSSDLKHKELHINTKMQLDSFLNSHETNITFLEINGTPIMMNKIHLTVTDSLINAIVLNKRLTRLILSGTTMRTIPKKFLKLKYLEDLALQGGEITNIDVKWQKLKKLSVLYLSQNNITNINIKWSKIKKLRFLDLSKNKILNCDTLINELIKVNKIGVLYLSNNKITEIPENIYQLTKLDYCLLNNNLIKNFPCSLNKFKKIELYLYANLVKEIPECLKKIVDNSKKEIGELYIDW